MSGKNDEARGSEHLIRTLQSGDRAALEALIADHLLPLRAFVRLRMSPLLRAHESGSDLVQSACADVLAGLKDLDFRGEAAFRGWLYTAVLNKLRKKERDLRAPKRDARRAAPLTDLYASVLSPSRAMIAEEKVREMEEVFDKLPEDYREVVALSRIARLSRAEIAARMGRSEASVRNLLSRALIRIARGLDRRSTNESSGA